MNNIINYKLHEHKHKNISHKALIQEQYKLMK